MEILAMWVSRYRVLWGSYFGQVAWNGCDGKMFCIPSTRQAKHLLVWTPHHPPTRSKTDQYNEGRANFLKSTDRPLFPPNGFALWLGTHRRGDLDASPVPDMHPRQRLALPPQLAETYRGMCHTAIWNLSVRSGAHR